MNSTHLTRLYALEGVNNARVTEAESTQKQKVM